MAVDPEKIEELALAPKRVRTDEGSLEERSVDELIKADRYNQTASAQTAVPYGMRIARTKPPGTV